MLPGLSTLVDGRVDQFGHGHRFVAVGQQPPMPTRDIHVEQSGQYWSPRAR